MNKSTHQITIERHYEVTPDHVWRLWTTDTGIESWWAPDGFTVRVERIDLRPGGELIYAMTATGPEQIAFMTQAGMPLTTRSRKTFTELTPTTRIAYDSLVDFVPDVEPYEFRTVVDLRPSDNGTHVTMTVEPMHDDVWTQRLIMGRENELDNLARQL
jgi:uncharacterized protein YndB with AHSA1/START domain